MKVLAAAAAMLVALQQVSPDALLARMDRYLESYQPRLSELVADETMSQELNDFVTRANKSWFGRVERTLASEVAFIALPDNAGWLGFRHVKVVDHKDVSDNQSLATALNDRSYDAARTLLETSAEHNLGLRRTTNLPNLPLEFLHRRNRDRLLPRLDGRERVRGVNADRLVFLERMKPTLITHPDGRDMPSVIRAWIDPRDGRLLRAEVNTFGAWEARTYDHRLRVEFEHDAKLDLLVPTEMKETFPGPLASGSGEAKYSNFRRFQTSGRIVPQ